MLANHAAIPAELKAMRRWAVCREIGEWDPERAETKKRKVPIIPFTRDCKASCNNPATLRTFTEAETAYRDSLATKEPFSGLQFCLLAGDDLVFVDLDDCREPDSGIVADWAQSIIDRLDSYTEVSLSGKGIHVFVHGALPEGRRRYGDIELYDRSKFALMTGALLPGRAEKIERRQSEIEMVHAQLPPLTVARDVNASSIGPLDEADPSAIRDLLISFKQTGDKARRLFDGDTTDTDGDDSRADYQLCQLIAFVTRDAAKIDEVFRLSALCRSKWTARANYRNLTIRAAVASQKRQYKAPKPKIDIRRAVDLRLDEIGNGERFIAQHGEDLRYVADWGQWITWDGARWKRDTGDLGVEALGKLTARSLYAEAERETNANRAAEIAKHAIRSQSVAKVRACIASARSEEGVPISAAELDRDPWVLCCPNGTVDLKTAKLRPSRKTDLLTKVAGAEYDRNAYASRWYTFLERVLPDADVRGYVQRAAGYALCGKCAEKALFFLYGATGDNGKTVFLSALLDVFGEYGLRAPAELLLANDHGSGNTLDKAMLCGARLVVTVEVEDGRRMAESVVREITGADRITARRLYEMPFEFDPTHTIFLAANHRPVIKCQDPAIWNRIKTIPFLEQIPKAEQDPLLTDKLREERAGILNWLLVGYQDWQEGGLREPAGVVAANEEYKLSVDVLADFLAERCVFDPGYATAGPELWIEYSTWCKNNEVRGIGKQALGARIREHAGVSAAVGIGPKASRGFRGIGIKNSVQQASL